MILVFLATLVLLCGLGMRIVLLKFARDLGETPPPAQLQASVPLDGLGDRQ